MARPTVQLSGGKGADEREMVTDNRDSSKRRTASDSAVRLERLLCLLTSEGGDLIGQPLDFASQAPVLSDQGINGVVTEVNLPGHGVEHRREESPYQNPKWLNVLYNRSGRVADQKKEGESTPKCSHRSAALWARSQGIQSFYVIALPHRRSQSLWHNGVAQRRRRRR